MQQRFLLQILLLAQHVSGTIMPIIRIVCDPSSGSIKLYLTEIRGGPLMFVVCLIGVWQRNL